MAEDLRHLKQLKACADDVERHGDGKLKHLIERTLVPRVERMSPAC